MDNYLQVFEKLKLAEKTAKEIEVLRDGYRPAARRGAVLFFVLSGMAAINSMYQYSLSSYLDVRYQLMYKIAHHLWQIHYSQVFGHSLRRSLPDQHLPKRLNNIISTLSLNIYNYACTGKVLDPCIYYMYIYDGIVHFIVRIV